MLKNLLNDLSRLSDWCIQAHRFSHRLALGGGIFLLLALAVPHEGLGQDKGGHDRLEVMAPQVLDPWKVVNKDGVEISSQSVQGKVTLLVFWAPWCPSCKRQMASLDALGEIYDKEPFQVVMVSTDQQVGGVTGAQYMSQNAFLYLEDYQDQGAQLRERMHVKAFPTNILLDKQGRMVAKMEGSAVWTDPTLRGPIEQLLAGQTLKTAPTFRERLKNALLSFWNKLFGS